MDKFLNILIILVAIILLAITVVAKATETSNVLSNGSFDGNADGWDLDGTAEYDGKTYSASGLSKVIRFSGGDGGSITQSITLGNINSDTKYISKVHGSIKSYGCNNSSGAWCSATGTDNNLDPVNTTITFNDGTQTEVLNYDFTSNYNDGVITSTFTINLDKDFHINNTTINVNVFGADKGNQAGMLGSIIDDLSLILTLDDLVIAQQTQVAEISQVGSLDASSIVDTLSSGVIDMHPADNLEIANLSTAISGINNIQDMNMDMNMADANHNHEMPVEIKATENMQEINQPGIEINMPDIQMPDIEMPDLQMPDNLPEINDIQIESVNEIKNEPETLQEIREEIPENNIEELPAELEQTDMEEDLKENQNEQQEETSTENEEVDGANEESELSDDSSTEEKEPKEKVNEEKESEEKEETAEEEIKEEPSANEEKVVKTAKSSKSEKKQGSESQNKSDKKTSVSIATPKIESDIVIQEIDLLQVVSFNKEYFKQTITDTLDLTKSEVDFYDGENGFNSDSAYAQNNIDFFTRNCQSDCWGDLHVRTNAVQIEQFRR